MKIFWLLLFAAGLAAGAYFLSNGHFVTGVLLVVGAICKAPDAFGRDN